MYRANVYESVKLIDNIYIFGIKNYELERNTIIILIFSFLCLV